MSEGGHSHLQQFEFFIHFLVTTHVYMRTFFAGAAAFKQTLPNKAMLEGGGTV